MGKYNKLLKYIPYFENEEIEFCIWKSGYPEYDATFDQFIKDVYDTDLLEGNYLNYLNENTVGNEYPRYIASADLDLLKSILTFIVRSERFCDGAWDQAIKEKTFLRILYRLKELEEDSHPENGTLNL